MNPTFAPPGARSLLDDAATVRKLDLNFRRNRKQDQTPVIDAAAAAFRYEDCRGEAWNPEPFSLLWGTPIWDGATQSQRLALNHLYWVAYYAQIVSAEIATIFFNQTSAAALYGIEDFRLVCDTLDLESAQERAHVAAFKRIGEEVEAQLFGERIFTYPMRTPFAETMVFADSGPFRAWWKRLQLRAFTLLSSGNAFIGCQYFTVRGLRTLNGKLVQHQLSQYYTDHPAQESAPLPSRVSYSHFLDESYHFNSSMIVSQDVVRSLRPPTAFERAVIDRAIEGCQRDHFHFSTVINGIFWYDPALLGAVYRVLRSPVFGLAEREALELMERSFCEESEGVHASFKTQQTALESYRAYLADMPWLSPRNRALSLMARSTLGGHLEQNRRAFARFTPPVLTPNSPRAPLTAPSQAAA